MKRMQFLFPSPLVQKLRGIAAALDRTLSEIVREAVREWVDARESERRKEPGR